MSIRLYIGNLPQTFEEQELVALLKSVGEGIRFKTVLDRETGACRGFKIPKKVVFGPIDKTSTGKVQKYLLRERAEAVELVVNK